MTLHRSSNSDLELRVKSLEDRLGKHVEWDDFRFWYHARIIQYLGDHMSSQEDLDAAVAQLNEALAEIDDKSTSTQESVDAIQTELDNLQAQVDAGQPVDLTGLNQAVASAQQEATDLSNLAADAASSVPPVATPPIAEAPPVEEPPVDTPPDVPVDGGVTDVPPEEQPPA